MKIIRFSLFFILLSTVAPVHGNAFEVPDKPGGRVADRAGILTQAAESKLQRGLKRFEDETTAQFVIATFPSLEGGNLEDASIRIAEQWKIGSKESDNGVLLLIFRDERKIRIEVGYGLEDRLTDATASLIIRNQIAPYFKQGDFDRGVLAGANAVIQVLLGQEGAAPAQTRSVSASGYQKTSMRPEDAAALLIFISLLLGSLFFVDCFRYRGYAKQSKKYMRHYSFGEWMIRRAFLFMLLQFVLEMLFYAMIFRGGRHYGSRGGFGGGGGSFGGGGASGGW